MTAYPIEIVRYRPKLNMKRFNQLILTQSLYEQYLVKELRKISKEDVIKLGHEIRIIDLQIREIMQIV